MDTYSQPGQMISDVLSFPIGVIIPTYNRSAALAICLEHLERQTWKNFEVIVVDDGSTDSTPEMLAEFRQHTSLHLRLIRQNNSGPARARNVAIDLLQTPLCLMIGDDIFASPGLILAHLRLHQQRPEMQVAALGLTRWSESGQTVTKFMRWLDDSGMQFAYNDLLRGTHPDWKHFYTSNISLKTAFLRANPFNESFTRAAVEDIELGYRLEVQHQLEVVFLSDALALHLHPTTFRQACNRMFKCGLSAQQFKALWPDSMPEVQSSQLRQFLRTTLLKNPWMLAPITWIAEILTTAWCPNPLMKFVLLSHYTLGFRHFETSMKAGLETAP